MHGSTRRASSSPSRSRIGAAGTASGLQAGLESLAAARATGRPPRAYRLQAEIAALHATAADAASTDWPRIAAAYDALLTLRPSPVVALNRAVAVAMADGPEAGLDALAELDTAALADYPLLPAVRADLLRRAGRRREAADAYLDAIAEARTEPERRLLRRRLAEVTAPTGVGLRSDGHGHTGRVAARVASTSRAICATSASSESKTASSRSRSQSSTTRRLPYRSPSKSRRNGSMRRSVPP